MENKNIVSVTITMSKEEKHTLRLMAASEDTTVSAIIRKWLHEHIEERRGDIV